MQNRDPESGNGILAETLNSIGSYVLVTMEEPLSLIESALAKKPSALILNHDMRSENLERLAKERKRGGYIVGFGGGTSCDTAKYLASEWDIPLIIAPSIISVDAWLCRSIAVRVEHKVRYIRDVIPERVLVDYSIVKRAPAALNRAGVCDVISIATALGDWLIARDIFGDRFDQAVFNKARGIVDEMLARAEDIKQVTDEGIQALVKGQVDEVKLCEEWGNARPEEGSEHFLAYCIEELTRDHYIHGNLVTLNILIVLKLQREKAVYDLSAIKGFLDLIGVEYSPAKQGIKRNDMKTALESVQSYVRKENLFHGLWHLDEIFAPDGEYSVSGILDWVYAF